MRGFTLTEMAVVLVIVALLVGGMIMPISTQQELRYVSDTDATLKNSREALLGFAAAQGRLPCPATAASLGVEAFNTGSSGDSTNGICATDFDGFLPAVTLGIRPIDSEGFAIDAWGQRIRYAVAPVTVGTTTRAITRTDGIRSATMNSVAATPMITVCASSTGITTSNCGTATRLIDNAPALIFSTGKNGAGNSADEQANSTTFDAVFVSHTPSTDYDDQLVWLSPHILFSRMMSARRLP